MNDFFRALRDEKAILILGGFAAGAAVLIPALLNEPADGARYAAELILALTAILAACRIIKRLRLARALRELKSNLSPERLPLPDAMTLTDRAYAELLLALDAEKRALAAGIVESRAEEAGYYTLWVHQMKTPIAAMRLLLDGMESEESAALQRELFTVERYADLALRYVKLKNIASDLVIENCALEPTIRAAVKQYALLFIKKRLTVTLGGLDKTVMTDGRWLRFILEQILSNAVKYTESGGVTITLIGNALTVRDTGVGIRAEDLPRIFERGFTGHLGRLDTRASGIGLSLAKKAADALNIRLLAESEPGKGTAVTLVFPETPPLILT